MLKGANAAILVFVIFLQYLPAYVFMGHLQQAIQVMVILYSIDALLKDGRKLTSAVVLDKRASQVK